MPEMIPVGNTGIQPNFLSSLSGAIAAKSGLIGLQQQQQNLQTGAYQQQSAQASAQQDQQKNQELQSLAQFTKSAAQDPSYQNADGSANVQKYQRDAMKVAPTYGQAYIGQMTSNFNGAVENRKAMLGLTKEQQGMVQSGVQSIAQGADATTELSRLRGVSTDPGYQNMLDNLLSHKPNTGMMPDAQAKQTEQQWAAGLSAHLGGPALATAGTVDTGGQIKPVTTSPYTGAIAGAGAPINKSPQAITNAAGQILNRNPASGAISTPSQAGPNLNPTAPQVSNTHAMATDDAGRYSQISQEGTNATQGAALADQVAQLADQVRTGKFSKFWADHLAVLKQDDPTITARQMLDKYAAQVKTMATMNASTDAERSGIDAGMPNPETMGTGAVKEAAQYVGGVFRQRGARQAYADNFVKQNGTSVGVRQADDQFMQSADPFVFTYRNLPAGPERQEFLRSHGITTPAAQAAFKDKLTKIQQYGGE